MEQQIKNTCPVCDHELEEDKVGEHFNKTVVQVWAMVTLYNQLMAMHKQLMEKDEVDLVLVEQCRLHGEIIAKFSRY